MSRQLTTDAPLFLYLLLTHPHPEQAEISLHSHNVAWQVYSAWPLPIKHRRMIRWHYLCEPPPPNHPP